MAPKPSASTESSDEEWEEVEETEKDVVMSENVEVELDLPKDVKRKQKKEKWAREMQETCIRRYLKNNQKELQLETHKVYLLCTLSHGMMLNRICNNKVLQAIAYSLLPPKYTSSRPKDVNAMFLTRFVKDITEKFQTEKGLEKLQSHGIARLTFLKVLLKNVLANQEVKYKLDLVLIFVILFRAMGFNTRLVCSFQPIQLKVPAEREKEAALMAKMMVERQVPGKHPKLLPKVEGDDKIPQVDGASDSPVVSRRTRSQLKRNAKDLNNCDATATTRRNKQPKTSDAENQIPPTALKSKAKTKKISQPKTKSSTLVKGSNTDLKSSTRRKKTLKISDTDDQTSKTIVKSETEAESALLVNGDTNDHKVEKVNTEKSPSKPVEKKKERVDETPLIKPLTNTKTRRKLRGGVKRKLPNSSKDRNNDDSSNDDNFEPVESDNSDSDFEVETMKNSPKRKRSSSDEKIEHKIKNGKTQTKKGQSRRPAPAKQNLKNNNYFDEWLEVYSEQDSKWICLDIFHGIVNHPEKMEKYASPPMHYVVGYENECYIKDLTARYASKWLTTTRKLRVGIADKDWWKNTLAPYATPDKVQDEEENADMQKQLLAQPIPTAISAFKNHPLFALRRHLLKYEAIYPADVPALGLIRGEEILPRSAIYVLHTRDKWLQSARTVIEGEKPYKMVASLWINMKLKQDMATLSMPLFGIWQTAPYVPGVAKDGKVPRNQYGNVDLFKPEMLPIGCVQLRLVGLQRVAKKLDIDIATAITGFDTHNSYPHPVTDGYIVCEEFKETLIAAWQEDQRYVLQREKEKREKRVYEHWKLLLKSLLARERVRRKYMAKDKLKPKSSPSKETKAENVSSVLGTAWQAKRLEDAKNKSKSRNNRGKGKQETLMPY